MFVFLVLITTALAFYVAWLWDRYQKVGRYMKKFPGPKTLPFFGNILALGRRPEQYLSRVLSWSHEFKYELFRIYAGPIPMIIICNPRHMELVLASSTLLYKEELYFIFRSWLGDGLLTATGQRWVKHRKLITPSFHFGILQDFLHVINETTDRFMLLLDEYAKSEDLLEAQGIVALCTMDVICECALGTRVNAMERLDDNPVVEAMTELCRILPERVVSVWKRFDFTYKFSSEYRLEQKCIKTLRKAYSKIIDDRREILKNVEKQQTLEDSVYKRPKLAFLDNLLTAEVDGRPLSFTEIFEEVSTFVFEGHDTTATAITFALHCLSRHPQYQAKAFQEQFDLYGHDAKRSPTYKELQEMKYLEMVIKETLRLFPSVPTIARSTTEKISLDGHEIPAGTALIMMLICVGAQPDFYENPYEFRPERFEPEKRLNAHPFDFLPFSAGPRNCIGQKFAMMELKCTLSKILRNFEILPAEDGLGPGIPTDVNYRPKSPYDMKLAIMVTLKSVNGVYVRLRKRTY